MNIETRIKSWLADSREDFSSAEKPFVTLSYAQSLDGSIAALAGAPLRLSSPASLRLSHYLRSLHDGILVGIGTVLSDDPQLTVRHCAGASPQPIVLDSQLRIPSTARLCYSTHRRCWVLTTETEHAAIQGLDITALQDDGNGHVCLRNALHLIFRRGIKSLMVEGGAQIITAFLKAKLADAAVLTIVPKFVGGYKAVTELKPCNDYSMPNIEPFFSERLGDDLIVWGNLNYNHHYEVEQTSLMETLRSVPA